MSVAKTKIAKKSKRERAKLLEASTAPTPVAQRTRLVCVSMQLVTWAQLSATTKRMLRVPILWRPSKSGPKPVRLEWTVGAKVFAYAVEDSAPMIEISGVLSAAGVTEITSAPWPYLLRRVPAGALFTDPTRTGIKADVETSGVPLLLRNRRGRWKRYDVCGALWPKEVQPDLAEHVEGSTLPSLAEEPKRFVVQEGTPKLRGTKWEPRSSWGSVAEAREEAERNAVHDARLGRSTKWRVVDLGTGAVRALWQHKGVLKKKRLTRLTFVPGFASKATPEVVAVPGDAS